MESLEKSVRESSIDEKEPLVLAADQVDNPATEDAAEQEYISSGESDEEKEPTENLNDVTKRRRAHNAQFEAL